MLGVAGMVTPELLGGLGIIPEETGLVWYKAGMIPAQGTYDYWPARSPIFDQRREDEHCGTPPRAPTTGTRAPWVSRLPSAGKEVGRQR